VIGINESAMLRWLIRDRQKSGISKEYHEAVAREGAAAEPLEPLPTKTPKPKN
jgi:hypothetical protein